LAAGPADSVRTRDTGETACSTTDSTVTTGTTSGTVTGITAIFTDRTRDRPGHTHIAVPAGTARTTRSRNTTGTAIAVNTVRRAA
jgi:hypothetical protein